MPGDYTLTEVTTPEGFKALDKPVKFHVDASGKIRLASDSSSLAAVNEGGVILNVTNLPSDRKLTLRKLVTNSKTTQKFDFTISYELDGKTVEQKLSLANGGEGTLDIPYGVEVTITEPKHDGYTLTFTQENTTLASGGSSCTIEKNDAGCDHRRHKRGGLCPARDRRSRYDLVYDRRTSSHSRRSVV